MDLLKFRHDHAGVIEVLADKQALFLLTLIAELGNTTRDALSSHLGWGEEVIELLWQKLESAQLVRETFGRETLVQLSRHGSLVIAALGFPGSPQLDHRKFTVGPFQRGIGAAIGNCLRRTLLRSIEGTAITAIRIEGVPHEFSHIPGVLEDAAEIIFNLKQIPFKINGKGARTARIRVEHPGEVLSNQIETTLDLEVLNRTMHIATVIKGGKLNIDLRLKYALGYIPANRNHDEDLPIGFIPIDSVHSPIRGATFTVEPARFGPTIDHDSLTIEVWTNGAISPEHAIGRAAALLSDVMDLFIHFEDMPKTVKETSERSIVQVGNIHANPIYQMEEVLTRSIEELELSVRSYNCLKNANIRTVADLVQNSEAEMLRTKNFGRRSLDELKEILTSLGLRFGMTFNSQGRLILPSKSPIAPTTAETDDNDSGRVIQ